MGTYLPFNLENLLGPILLKQYEEGPATATLVPIQKAASPEKTSDFSNDSSESGLKNSNPGSPEINVTNETSEEEPQVEFQNFQAQDVTYQNFANFQSLSRQITPPDLLKVPVHCSSPIIGGSSIFASCPPKSPLLAQPKPELKPKPESNPAPKPQPSNPSRILRRHKTNRKPRTPFTSEQLNTLEYLFNTKKYLTVEERSATASRLNLTDIQLKIWFQNRRAKEKRVNESILDRIKLSNRYGMVNPKFFAQ